MSKHHPSVCVKGVALCKMFVNAIKRSYYFTTSPRIKQFFISPGKKKLTAGLIARCYIQSGRLVVLVPPCGTGLYGSGKGGRNFAFKLKDGYLVTALCPDSDVP